MYKRQARVAREGRDAALPPAALAEFAAALPDLELVVGAGRAGELATPGGAVRAMLDDAGVAWRDGPGGARRAGRGDAGRSVVVPRASLLAHFRKAADEGAVARASRFGAARFLGLGGGVLGAFYVVPLLDAFYAAPPAPPFAG